MRVPQTTWSWLAALIDGEGAVMMTRRGIGKHLTQKPSKQVHFRYVVVVSNTERSILEAIIERTGIGVIYEHARKNEGSKHFRRRMYTWRINATEIKVLLPKVIPWLIIKKDRATLLLEAVRIAELNTPVAGKPLDWDAVNERLKRRNQIYLEIRRQNGNKSIISRQTARKLWSR